MLGLLRLLIAQARSGALPALLISVAVALGAAAGAVMAYLLYPYPREVMLEKREPRLVIASPMARVSLPGLRRLPATGLVLVSLGAEFDRVETDAWCAVVGLDGLSTAWRDRLLAIGGEGGGGTRTDAGLEPWFRVAASLPLDSDSNETSARTKVLQ